MVPRVRGRRIETIVGIYNPALLKRLAFLYDYIAQLMLCISLQNDKTFRVYDSDVEITVQRPKSHAGRHEAGGPESAALWLAWPDVVRNAPYQSQLLLHIIPAKQISFSMRRKTTSLTLIVSENDSEEVQKSS